MFRTIPILTLALALGACASEKARTDVTAQDPGKAGCVADTGTRIESQKGQRCDAGRTYTREDLERSGGATTGDAIKRVQPGG